MNTKNKIKIIAINMGLFALLFVLISWNKDFLRPHFGSLPFMRVLTGSFPNFIAAFIISLAFVNAVLIRKPKQSRSIVYAASALVFVILTFEELNPMWGASTQYDLFDIFGSALGSLLSILIFEIVIFIQNRNLSS